MAKKHVITITEFRVLAEGVSTFMVKDNSVRGCSPVRSCDVNIGDEIVLDNYFTLIIPDDNRKRLSLAMEREAKKEAVNLACDLSKHKLVSVDYNFYVSEVTVTYFDKISRSIYFKSFYVDCRDDDVGFFLEPLHSGYMVPFRNW